MSQKSSLGNALAVCQISSFYNINIFKVNLNSQTISNFLFWWFGDYFDGLMLKNSFPEWVVLKHTFWKATWISWRWKGPVEKWRYHRILMYQTCNFNKPSMEMNSDHTAEPAYMRLQGNKDFCLLWKKSSTKGVE